MLLSELGELDYRPVRPRVCHKDHWVLTETYEEIRKPIAPLPHNVGLTKS